MDFELEDIYGLEFPVTICPAGITFTACYDSRMLKKLEGHIVSRHKEIGCDLYTAKCTFTWEEIGMVYLKDEEFDRAGRKERDTVTMVFEDQFGNVILEEEKLYSNGARDLERAMHRFLKY